MSEPRLAGIFYGEGEGGRIDGLLVEVVASLQRGPLGLAGAIQHNTENGDRCRCDMTLEDLASGRRIDISEKRGPEARGCRLDSFALEEIVGLVAQSLNGTPDLMIVNRFGKREVEGRGFRQVIEQAMSAGVPVLVAVGAQQQAAWQEFTGAFGERLAPDAAEILAWCAEIASEAASRQGIEGADAA